MQTVHNKNERALFRIRLGFTSFFHRGSSTALKRADSGAVGDALNQIREFRGYMLFLQGRPWRRW
jgi:hypothetical protein